MRFPLDRDTPVLSASGTLDGRAPIANAREAALGHPEESNPWYSLGE